MPYSPVMSDSARIRFAVCTMMYFAQGIPAGLLGIAMPTWLAAQGVSAGQIASYMAVIVLPWAFKLVTGPFMDRYEYLPMGRRRPWVLGSQLGLAMSLLALLLIDDAANQIGLLMLCGVLINSFAATQDVAVDGMAIDLVPEGEQGRLNAFMSFGKAIGWACSSAASGIILVTWGLGSAAILAAAVAGLVLVVFTLVRERAGERVLPWSKGEAATSHVDSKSFFTIFRGLGGVLLSRVSLVVIFIMFLDGLVGGYGQALMPIAAVKLFGYTTPQWSQLVATMGLVGALMALGLGPLIDRFGAKRMLFFTVAVTAAHAFVLAGTQHYWQDSTYVKIMLAIWVILGPVTMVCAIALAMAICSPAVSATQFAIYMSIANLGASMGSKIYGLVAESTNYAQHYALMGMIVLVTLLVILFYRARPASSRTETSMPVGNKSGPY
jgi:MFS transporter, PAT family, beta-lactamase induction signal transducer AmpG